MEKENEEDKDSSLLDDIKNLKRTYCDFMSASKSVLKKLNNPETPEYRDINNILSEYAQNVIQDSKGPLKPDQLLKFLMTDVLRKKCKEPSTVIRKYSNDTEGVRKQLMEVFENIQKRMTYAKKQKELDLKFIKTIEKLDKTMEEETLKNTSSKGKQSILKEYFRTKNTSDISPDMSGSRNQNVEESVRGKHTNSLRKGEKSNRKEAKSISKEVKSNGKKKTNAGKENKEYVQLSSEIHKRLKLSSSHVTTEAMGQIQPGPEIDPELRDESVEEMSLGDSGKSNSPYTETMSVDVSDDYSQPMSLGCSQEINISDTDNGKDSSKCSINEETVAERHFYLRQKPFR